MSEPTEKSMAGVAPKDRSVGMRSELRIYFAGSIRAGRKDVGVYADLIAGLKTHGEVLTEHVGDYSLSLRGQTTLSDRAIHDRDVGWLLRSDIVIAEVTLPSLGVGYEVAVAAANSIPIIALHRTGGCDVSAMIAGCPYVILYEYQDVNEAMRLIHETLPWAVKQRGQEHQQ